jgi:hypothetical protein
LFIIWVYWATLIEVWKCKLLDHLWTHISCTTTILTIFSQVIKTLHMMNSFMCNLL